ncbi:MAG: hypothetical protein HC774_04470 [Sphingomonadales bacterium]|nr:hypothetical protein [Sphingomonadales bacterium]
MLQRLLRVEVPRLRQWITTDKPVRMGDCWQEPGLLLTKPEVWLADRLHQQGRFPRGILTVIDGADQLEDWTRQLLTVTLESADWDQLMQQFPQQADLIRDQRVQLTRSVFQHPANPYERYLLEASDRDALSQMLTQIAPPATLAGIAVLVDLGRWWQFYNLAMPWYMQPNSVMLEIGLCVMAYVVVLWLEFSPAILERVGLGSVRSA